MPPEVDEGVHGLDGLLLVAGLLVEGGQLGQDGFLFRKRAWSSR
jgi:hypothetical protein